MLTDSLLINCTFPEVWTLGVTCHNAGARHQPLTQRASQAAFYLLRVKRNSCKLILKTSVKLLLYLEILLY